MTTQVRYYGDKISNRIAKTPEGFLICQDVPISRTGYQEYLASELLDNPILKNKIIPVYRPASEVFDVRSLASFEGKPVTNEHPDEDVTPENYQQYSCGHVQNVHAGDGEDANKVLADLYITDPVLIKLIEKGKREISCGYYAEERKDSSGKIFQTRIRGNHVAVVQNGRAGNKVCIRDKNPFRGRKFGMRRRSLSKYIDNLRYLDEDPVVDDDILTDDEFADDELLGDDEFIGDDEFVDEDEVLDDEFTDDEFIGDDEFVDEDEILDDDEFIGDDEIVDEDEFADDDFEDEDEVLDEDYEDDDEVLDEDFEDDDFACDEDFEDDDEVLDDDFACDEDFEDDDFEDEDEVLDEDYIDDDEIDLTEKANTILNDARRTLRDAKRHLRRLRRRDAIILNDDDLEDEDIADDEILDEDDLVGDDDFEDEDEILDEDEFADDDEVLDDDEFADEDFEDDEFTEDDDELVDEDVVDGCHGDDDVEVTETDEIVDADESESIDTDKTKALREITEASRGITDPNERKQLQDAIYKALCGKTQMSDVMRITKKNRKSRMDAAAGNKGAVDVNKQQKIYDSFNPHKKTSF